MFQSLVLSLILAMFNPLVVDGDSISAYANVTTSPPLACQSGYAPTTTCWPDQVAYTLDSSNLTNFAGGGARMTGPGGIFAAFSSRDLSFCGANPNIFLWDIGANDVTALSERGDLTATFSAYIGEYRSIIGQCVNAGTPITSIYILNLTPIPGNAGDNELVPIWNAGLKLLPTYFPGIHYVDVYSAVTAYCQPLSSCYWDGIHLSILGDTVMAEAVLQALAGH